MNAGEIERSPMRAAPGSADVARLSTYANVIGQDHEDLRGRAPYSTNAMYLLRRKSPVTSRVGVSMTET